MFFFIFILTGFLTLMCGEGSQIGSVCCKIHKILFWAFIVLVIIGIILGAITAIAIAIFSPFI